MNRAMLSRFRAPETGEELFPENDGDREDISEGFVRSASGSRFPIHNGIIDLSHPRTLAPPDERARSFYEGRVEDYDRYLHLTFDTFGESEDAVREAMVDRLELKPDSRVLEVGAGSGRDSAHIVRRVPRGEFIGTDISPSMLSACKSRLQGAETRFELAVANASHLPFPDDSFDALFQFGGVGEFSDIRRFFREAVRVVRPGGRVVAGDESMPVWLRNTEFSRLLTFTNPQYAAPLPLEHLPIEARDVCVRWIIGGTFYLIDFTVGEGEPNADFDFVIPGPRGGTRRTRLYGQLEGVTPETKLLAQEACQRRNISMHEWLEEVVREAALKQKPQNDTAT